jgi:hypothetical protein
LKKEKTKDNQFAVAAAAAAHRLREIFASGLKRQDNDLIVIENAGSADAIGSHRPLHSVKMPELLHCGRLRYNLNKKRSSP